MRKLAVFILTLLFVIHGTAIAQQKDPAKPTDAQAPSSLSGTVVDVNEKPVAGFAFAVIPMHLKHGRMEPVDASLMGEMLGHLSRILSPNRDKDGKENKRFPYAVKTGEDGKFSIPRIPPGFVQLLARPNTPGSTKPDKKILSVQFGPITVFENTAEIGPPMERLTFALPAGVPVKNVKITVMQRLRIHAQVVYADGTPVANANVRFDMEVKSENRNASIGTSVFTNADGYFMHYMDDPGVYTISAEYQGLSGGASPFQLDAENAAPENLVIKLDGTPRVPKKQAVRKPILTPDGKPVERKSIPREIFIGEQGTEFVPILTQEDRDARKKAQQQKELEKSVWIINPANGHAYKKIPCVDWHDAQQTAIKEDAHLVSINNRAEQLWIQVIFGQHPFWIGLNDVEKEGTWQWDSGEPVTYTNWTSHDMFGSPHPDSEKDYVAMTFHFGGWQAVAPAKRGGRGHSPLWHITRHAIIEKDGLISKVPEPADPTEEEE